MEGVRHVPEAVENYALYAVGTASDAPSAEMWRVMLKVVEVVWTVLGSCTGGCAE